MKSSARLGVLLALALAGPAEAQNLLSNPEFDTDLSDWTSPAPTAPTWDLTDIDGAPDSGSARVVNDLSASDTDQVVLEQCVPITPGTYQFSGNALIPQGQSRSGSVVLRILGYGDATDCTGGLFLTFGKLTEQVGSWSSIEDELSVTPGQLSGPAGSIEFIFAVRKTESGGEFSAFVDRAFFGRPPLIFADRFEQP
jgi:hypothetical protein